MAAATTGRRRIEDRSAFKVTSGMFPGRQGLTPRALVTLSPSQNSRWMESWGLVYLRAHGTGRRITNIKPVSSPCVGADRKLTQVFYCSCIIIRREIYKVIAME